MDHLFLQLKEKNQEIEALKQKSKSRSDTLTKLLNEQKAEVKALMKEKAKLQYRFETEGQELIQMENKLKSANDIIRQKAANEQKLSVQITDLTNQNKSVRSDLREANVLYEELLKERDELQLKCNEIENALAENADAANGLEKRIAQAKELDRIHKEEVLGLKQANEDLSKQLKRAKSRVEDISKSKENMIAKKKKMEKEYQALADEMVQCRGEVVQLNMTVQGLEQELNQEKLKHIEHHEKKHEHSSGIFNKVKSALKILRKLHKRGGSKKAVVETKTDSASLFEQAMMTDTSGNSDEAKVKREKAWKETRWSSRGITNGARRHS